MTTVLAPLVAHQPGGLLSGRGDPGHLLEEFGQPKEQDRENDAADAARDRRAAELGNTENDRADAADRCEECEKQICLAECGPFWSL